MHGSSFFDVPALSRVDQSFRVYYGKLTQGWPLVRRAWLALLERFVTGRLRPGR